MKDAPDTLPPIVAKQSEGGALKRMLFGHAAADAYFEALDAEGHWYLWTEFSRFGIVRAYPCVLRDGDTTLVYHPYAPDNSTLLECWKGLVTVESVHTLQIKELSKADFKRIYRSYREA